MRKADSLVTLTAAVKNQIENIQQTLLIFDKLPSSRENIIQKEKLIDSLVRLMLHYNTTLQQVLTAEYDVTILADSFIPEPLDLAQLDHDYKEGLDEDEGDDLEPLT